MVIRKIFSASILIAVFLGTAAAVRQTNEQKYIKVPVKRKPADKDWTLRDTRTIELLEDFSPGSKKIATGRYGGRVDKKAEATGFFYPKKIADRWWPDAERMAMWGRESSRPFMITEFYAKGHDSGLPNNSGAGWLVQTQKDRARFYQNFTLGLLESKSCVGWHWFKYRDNNPEDLSTDPSNRDSNKGIIDYKYKPYVKLLEDMKKLNNELYALIDFFDSK